MRNINVVREEEYYQEAGCHLTGLEDLQTVHQKFGSQVLTCCEFEEGYADIGECKGRSKTVAI